MACVNATPLSVPDRFERLRSTPSGVLKGIVVPIGSMLRELDNRFEDMRAAGKGSLMILRGQSGAGKSTFLDTVGLFRVGVETSPIRSDDSIVDAVRTLGTHAGPRVVVIEGREALRDVSDQELEASLHAINSFSRAEGSDTLFVWPTNTDDLTERLAKLGDAIGASGLFGVEGPVVEFEGPPRSEWVNIAERTVSALNQGAQLSALGLTLERAEGLVADSETVGHYLATIRGELIRNTRRVRGLQAVQQERLWVVVIAGNDPDNDVAALTRGSGAYVDVERALSATEANIVSQLKTYPDQLGILGTVLDARVVHVHTIAAQAVARQFGNAALHAEMKARNASTAPDSQAVQRLRESELGVIASGGSLGVRRRGSRTGSSSQAAFSVLAEIAQKNDGLLNAAIGAGLVAAGLADGAEIEVPIQGAGLKYHSDIVATVGQEPVRLEVMWRKKTSRAEIANYTLTKLNNYARAIGLIGAPQAAPPT